MSIIWAPLNEVHCIWIYFNRVIDFQVSNLWFCGLYIARDLFWTVGSDFTMGGPFGHSVGAIIGAGIAALLLKHRLVDCENWDIVSVAKGIHVKDTLTDNTPPHLEKLKEKESPPVAQSSESSQKGQRRFDRAVANQDWENALAYYWYLEKIDKTDSVTVPQFRSLANGLFRIGEFREAAKFFEKLLAKDPRPRPTEVLKLAAILLDVEHRPRAALRSLEHIERHRLDATQLAKRNQIAEIAEMQVESGNLEMAHRV
jgi:tetratricopeptide (TPR) repeat protein